MLIIEKIDLENFNKDNYNSSNHIDLTYDENLKNYFENNLNYCYTNFNKNPNDLIINISVKYLKIMSKISSLIIINNEISEIHKDEYKILEDFFIPFLEMLDDNYKIYTGDFDTGKEIRICLNYGKPNSFPLELFISGDFNTEHNDLITNIEINLMMNT